MATIHPAPVPEAGDAAIAAAAAADVPERVKSRRMGRQRGTTTKINPYAYGGCRREKDLQANKTTITS